LFALEFHIPFYALRRGRQILDSRGSHGFELRSSRQLPLAKNIVEQSDFYYEGQISMLLIGVDEWLWTSYCCVDTYFGTEPNQRTYLDQQNPIEPATGGASRLEFPKMILITLSRRIMQVTGEWIALIEAFEDRMNAYVP
jgi:hypothetical protein